MVAACASYSTIVLVPVDTPLANVIEVAVPKLVAVLELFVTKGRSGIVKKLPLAMVKFFRVV
jgi:hypothetical protein